MAENVRVDKWLWAVRIYKTRSQATDACRKGHISIGDLPVKPSRIVHAGETVKVRKDQVVRSFKVVKLAEKRMSAKFVLDFLEDVTPPEEREIIEMQKNMRWITREKGTGRPTKKDRRDLDEFFDF
ncbi:RNA-binding S4 domain-containing protein [Maribellus comscasis]|uniref:RNA-binding S4 domain-containing protein n=1 Tax=Maribellus comscasis TaxID=2681766 RepID=A0A6I6JQR3_9BACT|nr:S4 domain-containing protein [Maribellus comscasis]QGY42343.1 RNA-binding S4 domain-containing protein [Maribellus comscasis]